MINPCSECGDYASDTEVFSYGGRGSIVWRVRCRSCGYESRAEGSKEWAIRSWNRENPLEKESSP